MTLDEAIDRLYSVEPAEFVAERKRLAKELGGEEGKQLAALRKPTVAAWALNQLARRQRRDVDLLLDAGHRLRQAQAGVLRGTDRDEFERARETERDAIRRLTHAADTLLGGASAATLKQIGDTLRAAAVSEEGRELLARGRFEGTLEAGGFELLGDLAPATPPKRRQAATNQRDDAKAKREALARERARVRELEREAVKLEREAEAARERADRARAEADAARRALG
jgi:hypothetical protein